MDKIKAARGVNGKDPLCLTFDKPNHAKLKRMDDEEHNRIEQEKWEEQKRLVIGRLKQRLAVAVESRASVPVLTDLIRQAEAAGIASDDEDLAAAKMRIEQERIGRRPAPSNPRCVLVARRTFELNCGFTCTMMVAHP